MRKQMLSISEIQQIVADYFCMTAKELIGKSRKSNVLIPRQIAIYLCGKHTLYNQISIANAFNLRDRTSVFHNNNVIKYAISENTHPVNEIIKNSIEALEEMFVEKRLNKG